MESSATARVSVLGRGEGVGREGCRAGVYIGAGEVALNKKTAEKRSPSRIRRLTAVRPV
jgi:hypothetical protein